MVDTKFGRREGDAIAVKCCLFMFVLLCERDSHSFNFKLFIFKKGQSALINISIKKVNVLELAEG